MKAEYLLAMKLLSAGVSGQDYEGIGGIPWTHKL